MRKLLMTLGLSSLMITNIFANKITLNINDSVVSTPVAPLQESGTTLVPLRIIGEDLGALLGWDGPSQTVTITKGDTEIKLVINSKIVTVNGQKNQLLLAPKLMKGTTMVPLRFIGENLDSEVDWDGPSRTVFVKSKTKEDRYFARIELENAIYEGEVVMRNGEEVLDGQGKAVFHSGEIHQGTFRNDMLNGQGKISYVNRNTYTGQIKNNKSNGYGKYVNVNGDVYEGEFKDDLFHGQGTLAYRNGETYKGTFKNGVRQGKGKTIFQNGAYYEGEYENNMFHGQGKYTFANGKVQEGRFEKNEFKGK